MCDKKIFLINLVNNIYLSLVFNEDDDIDYFFHNEIILKIHKIFEEFLLTKENIKFSISNYNKKYEEEIKKLKCYNTTLYMNFLEEQNIYTFDNYMNIFLYKFVVSILKNLLLFNCYEKNINQLVNEYIKIEKNNIKDEDLENLNNQQSDFISDNFLIKNSIFINIITYLTINKNYKNKKEFLLTENVNFDIDSIKQVFNNCKDLGKSFSGMYLYFDKSDLSLSNNDISIVYFDDINFDKDVEYKMIMDIEKFNYKNFTKYIYSWILSYSIYIIDNPLLYLLRCKGLRVYYKYIKNKLVSNINELSDDTIINISDTNLNIYYKKFNDISSDNDLLKFKLQYEKFRSSKNIEVIAISAESYLLKLNEEEEYKLRFYNNDKFYINNIIKKKLFNFCEHMYSKPSPLYINSDNLNPTSITESKLFNDNLFKKQNFHMLYFGGQCIFSRNTNLNPKYQVEEFSKRNKLLSNFFNNYPGVVNITTDYFKIACLYTFTKIENLEILINYFICSYFNIFDYNSFISVFKNKNNVKEVQNILNYDLSLSEKEQDFKNIKNNFITSKSKLHKIFTSEYNNYSINSKYSLYNIYEDLSSSILKNENQLNKNLNTYLGKKEYFNNFYDNITNYFYEFYEIQAINHCRFFSLENLFTLYETIFFNIETNENNLTYKYDIYNFKQNELLSFFNDIDFNEYYKNWKIDNEKLKTNIENFEKCFSK